MKSRSLRSDGAGPAHTDARPPAGGVSGSGARRSFSAFRIPAPQVAVLQPSTLARSDPPLLARNGPPAGQHRRGARGHRRPSPRALPRRDRLRRQGDPGACRKAVAGARSAVTCSTPTPELVIGSASAPRPVARPSGASARKRRGAQTTRTTSGRVGCRSGRRGCLHCHPSRRPRRYRRRRPRRHRHRPRCPSRHAHRRPRARRPRNRRRPRPRADGRCGFPRRWTDFPGTSRKTRSGLKALFSLSFSAKSSWGSRKTRGGLK